MNRQRLISVLAAVIASALVPAIAQAERVGFSFQGTLEIHGGSEATLFDVPNIPNHAAITGAFAYETTTPGVGTAPTVYAQSIEAGFTMNIGNMLQLSTTDFAIRISNDFQRSVPAETVDTFTVRFDSASVPSPKPLTVNGIPWTGIERNTILLHLSFPSDTFADTSLPSQLPDTFSTTTYSNLGYNSVGIQPFAITSASGIIPPVGDYNIDGVVGPPDYAEWRRTFGCTGSVCGPADGNSDGIVDAADYVVWRRADTTAIGSGGLVTQELPVPEPSGLVLSFLFCTGLASAWRTKPRHWHGR